MWFAGHWIGCGAKRWKQPVERLTRVNQNLEKEIGILEVQSQIQNRAKEEMSKTQRDYYLREQLRQIKNELGDGDVHGEEMEELRAKIGRAGLPDEARIEAEKQVRRLDQMHAESAEAGVLRTYIEWLVEIPWNTASEDLLDEIAVHHKSNFISTRYLF